MSYIVTLGLNVFSFRRKAKAFMALNTGQLPLHPPSTPHTQRNSHFEGVAQLELFLCGDPPGTRPSPPARKCREQNLIVVLLLLAGPTHVHLRVEAGLLSLAVNLVNSLNYF